MTSKTVEVWVEVWRWAKPHSERNVRQHVVTDVIIPELLELQTS